MAGTSLIPTDWGWFGVWLPHQSDLWPPEVSVVGEITELLARTDTLGRNGSRSPGRLGGAMTGQTASASGRKGQGA